MKNRILCTVGILFAGLMAGCGKVEEKAAEVSNSLNLTGRWLMTESSNANKVAKAIQKESMVLTFKDGKAAFSPTNSVKGKAVFATVSKCTAGPRPYKTENKDIVFAAVAGCPEKKVTVTQLDKDTLKFPDPEKTEIVRTFVRLDEAQFKTLVAEPDRTL